MKSPEKLAEGGSVDETRLKGEEALFEVDENDDTAPRNHCNES